MRAPLHPLRPGRLGMVDAICFIGRIEDPATIDDLATLSSAASAAYVWDPAINPPQEPALPFNPSGELFSNYGVFESLAYATGLQVCEVNHLTPQDWRGLVQFELAEDRPVLTLGLRGALTPALIIDATLERRAMHLKVLRAGAAQAEEVTLTSQENPQGDSEDFVHWMVFVREGQRADWAPSIGRLRLDMLRWLARHSHSAKEFFHETRANYAPGLAAQATMARLLRDELPAQLREDAPPRAQLTAYLNDHVAQLAQGRATAARALLRWADELGDWEDTPIRDLEAGRAALRDAAAHWSATAAVLGGLPAQDAITQEALAQLAHAWRVIAPGEQAAAAALGRLLAAT